MLDLRGPLVWGLNPGRDLLRQPPPRARCVGSQALYPCCGVGFPPCFLVLSADSTPGLVPRVGPLSQGNPNPLPEGLSQLTGEGHLWADSCVLAAGLATIACAAGVSV